MDVRTPSESSIVGEIETRGFRTYEQFHEWRHLLTTRTKRRALKAELAGPRRHHMAKRLLQAIHADERREIRRFRQKIGMRGDDVMIAALRWWCADRLVRIAAWLSPDPKLRNREPFDVVISKEARAGARSDVADRLFGRMSDVERRS